MKKTKLDELMEKKYGCIIVGIDEYGDTIVKKFVKEDENYLKGYEEDGYREQFFFDFYTSKDYIDIKDETELFRFKEYGVLSIRVDSCSYDDKVDNDKELVNRLKKIKTRCMAIRMIGGEVIQDILCWAGTYGNDIIDNIGMPDFGYYYGLSVWDKPYNEIEIIYEK